MRSWHVALTKEEEKLLSEVDVGREWELLEAFSRLVRVSGTEDERKAAEYLSRKLSEYGVRHSVFEPDLYISRPKKASVTVLELEYRELRHDDVAMNPKTPSFSRSGTYEGEVIPVETRQRDTMEDFFAPEVKRIDASGKAVLMDGLLLPKLAVEAQAMGARAVISISPGRWTHEGIISPIWGTPTLRDIGNLPNIIAATISKVDGELIRRYAVRGTVRVRVETELEEGWFKCPLVVAEIWPPNREDGDFILLHGHYDSWHVGIGDNAVGNAVMLEVARILQNNRSKLKRSVKIAWWPGHSTGRYAGSTWFADRFANEIWDGCVAHLNCDSPGCKNATSYDEVMAMAETRQFLANVIKDVTGKGPQFLRPVRAGDYSFHGLGVTGMLMLSSSMPRPLRDEKGYYPVGGCGGNIEWHTEYDDMRVADRGVLAADTKIYLLATYRIASEPIYPFDHRETVKESIEIVDSYQEKAGHLFDLTPTLTALRHLLKSVEKLYASLRVGRMSRRRAQQFNRVLKRIARTLIPLSYTRAGEFGHDPALEVKPYPALAEVLGLSELELDETRLRFAQTQLTREQNRIVQKLNDLRRDVEDSVKRLKATR